MDVAQDVIGRIGIDAPGALAVVVSAVGIYLAFLVLVRLFGQRVLSRMSTFDAVVVIMLGAVAGRVVVGNTPVLAAGVLGLSTLFALEAAFGLAGSGLRGAAVLNNRSVLLMAGDQVLTRNLRRAHVTQEELFATLREEGVRNFEEVACVVFEASGAFSVLKRGVPIAPRLLEGVRDAGLVPAELLDLSPPRTPPGPTAPRRPGR